MRLWNAVVGWMLAAGIAATAPASEGDIKAGKAVYDSQCKTCHGTNGEGNPAIAKAMNITLRGLGSKEVQSKSDEVLKKESIEGTGKMKPVRGLSDQQIHDLLAFLRSLAKS